MEHLPRPQVHPNPKQPREFFDTDALNELAASVAQYGIMQPLVVVPDPDQPDTFMIVAGERRWRAAGIAGLDTVPAIVRHDLDADEVHVLATTENLLREDMKPLEEARAFQVLRERGQSNDEIAERLGVSPAFIQKRMSLLKLDPNIQKLVDSGSLSIVAATEVARLNRENQWSVVRGINHGNLESVQQIIGAARTLRHREQQIGMDLGDLGAPEPVDPAKARKDRERVDRVAAAVRRLGDLVADMAELSTDELADALGFDGAKARDGLFADAERGLAAARRRLQEAQGAAGQQQMVA